MTTQFEKSLLGNAKVIVGGDSDPDTNSKLAKVMYLTLEEYNQLPEYSFWVYDKTRKRKKKNKYRIRPLQFKTPKIIANEKSCLYRNDAELEKSLRWMVFESGYYTSEMYREDRPALPYERTADTSELLFSEQKLDVQKVLNDKNFVVPNPFSS